MLIANKKRIAFIAHSVFTYGGEQRVLCLLANELIKDFDITIFTEDDENNNENPFQLNNKIIIEYFKPFKANFWIKILRGIIKLPVISILRNFSFTWKLTHYNNYIINRLIKRLGNNFDIVIPLADFPSVLLGYAKKKGLNAKVIAWQHSSFECYFCTPKENLWKQDSLFKEASKYFSKCVVLNEDYAEKYKEHFNINCNVIYNPRSFVSKEKAKLENKIIFTSCRLSIKTKGLDLLLKAFSVFIQSNPDWILLIAGDGKEKQKIQDIINKYNMIDNVSLLGYRSDIKELLLQSSIFVLSSRWEGFPLSVTEAFECGVPCIAFDIPAIIPFKNSNGILIAKKYDTDEFADCIKRLADHFDTRYEFGKNAAIFSENLSLEKFTKKWKNIIIEL